nr:DUF2791 family P-loop domain-containing protein [Candidatus Freyarchaeota archaeon]
MSVYREYLFEGPLFNPSFEYEIRGREKELDKIKNFLKEAFEEESVRSMLVLGDYGYGKSFMLYKIQKMVEKKEIEGAEKTITAWVVIAETEPVGAISYEYVTNIFKDIGPNQLFEIASKLNLDQIEKFKEPFKSILRGLKDRKESAFNWLMGETQDAREKKELGVKRKLKTSEVLNIFMDFLEAMKTSGYDNLLVLLDEFEYAVNVYSEVKLTQLFHTFKSIFDRFIKFGDASRFAKHIQVIAMTPKGFDAITDLETKLRKSTGGGGITPWLSRMRFDINHVILGPLDKEAVTQIIKDRIEAHKVPFKERPFETFPFIHPEFFDMIYLYSGGNPRDVLYLTDIVLKKAAKDNIKEITGKYTEAVLKEYGIVKQI